MYWQYKTQSVLFISSFLAFHIDLYDFSVYKNMIILCIKEYILVWEAHWLKTEPNIFFNQH